MTWYERRRRDLPWRRRTEPYGVWLSEIMLQQTQVATVIPYYARFLRRFPTVERLAAAEPDDVLRLWAGLGYYARARSLHRAARTIVDELGGAFPETAEAWRRLPGVGRYTAGAIASIVYNERAAAVDGNAARVLGRLFATETRPRDAADRERAWRLAEALLPRRRCGDFNQALMELGATVCLTGRAARCLACPLRTQCAARRGGTVADVRGSKSATRRGFVKEETHVVAALRRDGRWLFVRRPPGGLWGGLWSLPTDVLNGEKTAALAKTVVRELGYPAARVRRPPFCELTHKLTHRTIRFVGHVCSLEPPGRHRKTGANGSSRWLTLERSASVGVSTGMRKVLAALRADEADRRRKNTPAERRCSL